MNFRCKQTATLFTTPPPHARLNSPPRRGIPPLFLHNNKTLALPTFQNCYFLKLFPLSNLSKCSCENGPLILENPHEKFPSEWKSVTSAEGNPFADGFATNSVPLMHGKWVSEEILCVWGRGSSDESTSVTFRNPTPCSSSVKFVCEKCCGVKIVGKKGSDGVKKWSKVCPRWSWPV